MIQPIRQALRGVRVDLPLMLLALGIMGNPYYVLPSGLPQPGDLVIMLAIAVMAVVNRGRLHVPLGAVLPATTATAYVGWVAIVSLTWTMLLGDLDVARPVAFGAFNLGAFLTILGLPHRYGPRATTAVAVIYALSMTAILLVSPLFYEPWQYRQRFMFNNPNQVGYFAVFSASCYAVVPHRRDLPAWLDAWVLGIASYFVVMSASRAAFIGLVALVVFVVLSRRALNTLAIGGLLAALLAVPLLFVGPEGTPGRDAPGLGDRAERLTDLNTGTERGHDRILDHPEYTILGAGEGALYRFDRRQFAYEIHSNPGTILFSYGVVGLGLAGALLGFITWHGGWTSLLWLSPPLLVGLTHNTLRQTDFWIFLALAVLRVAPRAAPSRAAPRPPARVHTGAPPG